MSVNPISASVSGQPGSLFGRLAPIEQSISHLTDGEKLELIARVARSIQGTPVEDETEVARQQSENLLSLIERLEAMPSEANLDGFSGRDHDQILYGWSK